MIRFLILISFLLQTIEIVFGQSLSFKTYMNPIIPGDHPDPTLTKIENYFYTSGSSFNPTPKIYRSTDLVHWEVVAQPVSASWTQYGDSPGGGIWGGHMVLYKGIYWHYFGRGGSMYFVTADQPEGSWSTPTRVTVPAGMPGLGVDNSIFIDDDTGKWYLLSKAGRENNHIVELGEDGQPNDVVLDLTWLNPDSEGNPYGWAEGPVMWKYNGYYYYSFAQHLAGSQYVMRSDTLTDNKADWTIIGENIFTGNRGTYNRPNHISPVVMLDDSTSWTIAHSYYSSNSWYAHGRQGLLCRVTYNEEGFPEIQYPPNNAVEAPVLPSSGIPWMVPKSDTFNETDMKPEWSFLGYTPEANHSLTKREGWLYLEPYRGINTVIQNDGEHSYSLITRVDFEPESTTDKAGLWIINGPETHHVKVYSTQNDQGQNVLAFSFQRTPHEIVNTIGSIVWLKLTRNDHKASGYYSPDGFTWSQIGESIDVTELDIEQTQFNNFTGNQQGVYVEGKPAFFDLYIYRDAYTNIFAQHPANAFGVTATSSYLRSIHNNDWAMYAGIEFGNNDYPIYPDSLELEASGSASGGVVEVWLDSIDTGKKIAQCNVKNTGGLTSYEIFTADVDSVCGTHDVYLSFLGSGTEELFRIKRFKFLGKQYIPVSVENYLEAPKEFKLYNNYPNPFNPATNIKYGLPKQAFVKLNVYNAIGQRVMTLVNQLQSAGDYEVNFDAGNLGSGIFFFRIEAADFIQTKKMILLK